MEHAAGLLLSIALIIGAGYFLAIKGFLDDRAVEGLRKLITELTLPLLLFDAFLRLEPDGRNVLLALVIAAACAALGLAGSVASRLFRLPKRETVLLFQGFEAGMLGYALFGGFHGREHLPAFAALDLGQVVYVFTVLMAQMQRAESGRVAGFKTAPRSSPRTHFPWKDILRSRVLWAIGGGIAISLLLPGLQRFLTAPEGFTVAITSTVGGMTSPLVCLVIGASLKGGLAREQASMQVVVLRMLAGLAAGSLIAFMVIPALGFSSWHAKAAMVLFVLPPPFVIPVYYHGNTGFIGRVLTVSTAVSVILISLLVLAGAA